MYGRKAERLPASWLVLIASVTFTLTSFLVFRVLWGVGVHPLYLAGVMGLQAMTPLLGGRRILTSLGASSLAAVVAVSAYAAAVFLLFPRLDWLRAAGFAGGAVSLLFLLTSTVTAYRETGPEAELYDTPLAEENAMEKRPENKSGPDPTDESGSGGTGREVSEQHPPAQDVSTEPAHDGKEDPGREPAQGPMGVDEPMYTFDDLSDESLMRVLGPLEEGPTDISDVRIPWSEEVETAGMPSIVEDDPLDAPVDLFVEAPAQDTVIPSHWVEEAAREMAYEALDQDGEKEAGEEPVGGIPEQVAHEDAAGDAPSRRAMEYRMRSHYRVMEALTGELLGTFYGDEGYSTLDLVTLQAILSERLGPGKVSIVQLDWSNFDEVEVHVQTTGPAEPAEEASAGVSPEVPLSDDSPGDTEWGEVGAEAEPDAAPGADITGRTSPGSEQETGRERPHTGEPRYVIYDRRTIKPMGEYVPEGDQPRVDRLTLYRMFPQFDFRSFEIDSIRWQDDEVRILIRGEKKGSRAAARQPAGKPSGDAARPRAGAGTRTPDEGRKGRKDPEVK
ncbi:MAG: hypothetical protein JSV00_01895 [bacterium]|nr:MAG: hypothetical protein JSV00_01895 [bacterium]